MDVDNVCPVCPTIETEASLALGSGLAFDGGNLLVDRLHLREGTIDDAGVQGEEVNAIWGERISG